MVAAMTVQQQYEACEPQLRRSIPNTFRVWIARHPADAEDLLQEALLGAWKALGCAYDPRHPAGAIAYIGALRAAQKYIASKRSALAPAEIRLMTLGDIEALIIDDSDFTEAIIEGAEKQQLADEALELASARQREILLLCMQGLSYAEIARYLKLAEGSVMWHLNALRAKVGRKRGDPAAERWFEKWRLRTRRNRDLRRLARHE